MAKRANPVLDDEFPTKAVAPEFDFKCHIGQPATMRTMIDMLMAVVPSCEFHVECADDFTGLRVERLDETKSCMVHARLRCDVELPDSRSSDVSFAVSLKEMSAFMRVVHSHYIMDLTKRRASDKVTLVSRDQVTEAMINSFEMSMQSDEYDKRRIQPGDYDYTLIVDLPEFRSIVKMCKDLGADRLRITVYESTKEQVRTMVLRLNIATLGQKADFFFRSVIDESGHFPVTGCDCEVDNLDDTSEWTCTYDDQFKNEKLSVFIRSMDRAKVTLRVSSGKPIIVIFQLGGDDSYVYYILGPSLDE